MRGKATVKAVTGSLQLSSAVGHGFGELAAFDSEQQVATRLLSSVKQPVGRRHQAPAATVYVSFLLLVSGYNTTHTTK